MSGSLLLIAVVWIVLLAPLLLRNQSPVRRTAKALTETRVLHQGGEAMSRKKRLAPAAESFRVSDADEELELVDAEPEFFLLDDEDESRPLSLKDRAGLSGRGRKFSRAAKNQDSAEAAEPETVDAEPVEAEPVDAEIVTETADQDSAVAAAETIDGEVVEAETEAETETEATEAAESSTFRSHSEADTGSFAPIRLVAEAEEDDQAHDAEDDQAETSRRQVRSISDAYFRGSDLDPEASVEEAERGVENGEKEAAAHATAMARKLREEEESTRAELDDEDMQYLAARKGRGVYDPVASQAAAQRRLKRRKQMLLALLVLCIVSVGAGVIFGSAVWIAPVIALGVTAMYLYFLCRSAIEEAKMRQRRIARMRRARLGVRNTEDEELGVPDRLRRPGAVIVEADDADPEFDHLSYIDSRDYFDYHDEDSYYADDAAYGRANYGSQQRIHAV